MNYNFCWQNALKGLGCHQLCFREGPNSITNTKIKTSGLGFDKVAVDSHAFPQHLNISMKDALKANPATNLICKAFCLFFQLSCSMIQLQWAFSMLLLAVVYYTSMASVGRQKKKRPRLLKPLSPWLLLPLLFFLDGLSRSTLRVLAWLLIRGFDDCMLMGRLPVRLPSPEASSSLFSAMAAAAAQVSVRCRELGSACLQVPWCFHVCTQH